MLPVNKFEGPDFTPSVCSAPICRQFWKAGNYDDALPYKLSNQNSASYLNVHPKFLHSNATSHKWVFGAIAELVDNSVDQIHNGATFVVLDKTVNPRDNSPALLIHDDGGGMDPGAMRGCLSFGFSDNKLESSIGKYGNGFKTSSMRLGADVIIFSRPKNERRITQSIGMLSYTFLMQTGQESIVVPKVDYQFDSENCIWMPIQDEKQFSSNLAVLLQWSPYCTLDKILDQCEKIGPHGTRIVIYNLWHDDFGRFELDFETDSEDILISGKMLIAGKPTARESHLANRLHYSLRTYLSILYFRIPDNFCILLRGQPVHYHNIVRDLQDPEFIVYKPHNVEKSVITSIGFLKDAAEANIHGFNVYHKNRLILPFWHVLTYSSSRGRGVVGVLEADFMEPTHNKQDFERTPIFQKLETRLKQMALEYWDHHCGLIGHRQVKKSRSIQTTGQLHYLHQNAMPKNHHSMPSSREVPSGDPNSNAGASSFQTSGDSQILYQENIETEYVGVQDEVLEQDTQKLYAENKRLRTLLGELENRDKELDTKIAQLTTELQEERRSLERLSLDVKSAKV